MQRREKSLGVIKTGTYTGDGTTGQTITGVGFRPIVVKVFEHPDDSGRSFVKLNQGWSDSSFRHGSDSHAFANSAINSLDADGFTVDDNGGDWPPNTNSAIYDYIAFG